MKTAKSYKFLLLIATLITAVALGFGFMTGATVKAESAPSFNQYFTVNGVSADACVVEDDVLNFPVIKNDNVKIKNSVVLNDLEIVLIVPETISKFKIRVVSSSFDVNGNYNSGTESFDKDITSLCTVEGYGEITVKIGVLDNLVTFDVTGDNVTSVGDTDDKLLNEEYYKISKI